MASTRRKAAAVAIAVVGVAGLSLAAAAQLTLTTESLGAGSIDVGSCDNSVAVTYTRAWDVTDGEDVTTAVNFGGVDAACAGLDYELTLLGASNSIIGTASGSDITLVDDAFSVTVDEATADIQGVALVIFGN